VPNKNKNKSTSKKRPQAAGRKPAKPARIPVSAIPSIEGIARLLGAGRVTAAVAQSDQLLRDYSKNDALASQLATEFHRRNQHSYALIYIDRALEINAHNLNTLVDKGVILLDSDPDEAITCFKQVLAVQPRHVDAMVKLGYALNRLGQLDKAKNNLIQASRLDPKRVDIYLFLANISRFQGNLNEAKTYYKKVVKLDPEHGLAHRMLSLLTEHDAGDKHLETMRLIYARSSSADTRCQIGYGLAKAYDDLHQYQTSFDYYQQANKLVRTFRKTPVPNYQSNFSKVKAIFTSELLESLTKYAIEEIQPIFVLGMPRSGTSLVEQILASHSSVYGAGECFLLDRMLETNIAGGYPGGVNIGNAEELAKTFSAYCHQLLAKSPDHDYITDKTPHNFQYIGLIGALLPNAKIVHCRRDPVATCVSIFTQGFNSNHHYASDLRDLGEYYCGYSKLMEHWANLLPNRIYTVDYEALVTDTEMNIESLLNHCGLDFEESCLDFHANDRAVFTPSFQQVRQPVYQNAVSGWRRYEPWLEELMSGLAPLVSTKS
jgi:Sulfotransferase family/Tetratricopeptide repeat